MLRKPLTVAIVLLFAGLAPAAAIIGFCTRMPCCAHESEARLALATNGGDCCTTITCYDIPTAKLAASAPAAQSLASPLTALPPVPRFAPALARTRIDTSPPRGVIDRLAILSILLI
jgi:hypothetical protein